MRFYMHGRMRLRADVGGLHLSFQVANKLYKFDEALSFWGSDLYFNSSEIIDKSLMTVLTGKPMLPEQVRKFNRITSPR